MPDVTFGEVSFDPIEPSDFRMSIEGASRTGKSNTLAVFIEDLREAQMPMFIVDGVGTLTSIRNYDESVIVVGKQGYDAVTLPMPVDQLDRVADLVYDHGLKVMLAPFTYESGPDEDSREHRAVANALGAVYDRAKDTYMGAGRTKVLTMIDEAHVYCPERGAQHVTVDDEVRRARAGIINCATKGGNYGINTVLSYQRRAYIQNGALTQVDNWVVHNLEAGDRQTAASQLNVDGTEIQGLTTGEVLIYGTITDRRVVGPTQIRKRESPDPRDDDFTVPDPPEDLSGVLEHLQEEIEEEEGRAREEQREIERLRDEIESKEEEIDQLEDQLNTQESLRRLLSGGGGGDGEQVPEEVMEELESLREQRVDLEERLGEKEDELAAKRNEIVSLDKEIEDLETRVAELEPLEDQVDLIEKQARNLLAAIGREDPEVQDLRAEYEELQDEIAAKEAEIEQLEDRIEEGQQSVVVPTDYEELINDPDVQEQIQDAVENTDAGRRYIKGLIATIVENGGPVTYQQVAENLNIGTTSHISRAATVLETRKIVDKHDDDRPLKVDLNIGGVEEVKQKAAERESVEGLMENIG